MEKAIALNLLKDKTCDNCQDRIFKSCMSIERWDPKSTLIYVDLPEGSPVNIGEDQKRIVINLLKDRSCDNCFYGINGSCNCWGQISKEESANDKVEFPKENLCTYWIEPFHYDKGLRYLDPH